MILDFFKKICKQIGYKWIEDINDTKIFAYLSKPIDGISGALQIDTFLPWLQLHEKEELRKILEHYKKANVQNSKRIIDIIDTLIIKTSKSIDANITALCLDININSSSNIIPTIQNPNNLYKKGNSR